MPFLKTDLPPKNKEPLFSISSLTKILNAVDFLPPLESNRPTDSPGFKHKVNSLSATKDDEGKNLPYAFDRFFIITDSSKSVDCEHTKLFTFSLSAVTDSSTTASFFKVVRIAFLQALLIRMKLRRNNKSYSVTINMKREKTNTMRAFFVANTRKPKTSKSVESLKKGKPFLYDTFSFPMKCSNKKKKDWTMFLSIEKKISKE